VVPSSRPFAKALYQLVPAAFVSAVGIALLSSLANPVSPAAPPPEANAPITADAVFIATPRMVSRETPAVAEKTSLAPAMPKPRPSVPPPAHRLTSATPVASGPVIAAASPLPIVPPAAEASRQTMGASVEPIGMMPRLRRITAAVGGIPLRAVSRVAGWFSDGEPPRPPSEIPAQNFM